MRSLITLAPGKWNRLIPAALQPAILLGEFKAARDHVSGKQNRWLLRDHTKVVFLLS